MKKIILIICILFLQTNFSFAYIRLATPEEIAIQQKKEQSSKLKCQIFGLSWKNWECKAQSYFDRKEYEESIYNENCNRILRENNIDLNIPIIGEIYLDDRVKEYPFNNCIGVTQDGYEKDFTPQNNIPNINKIIYEKYPITFKETINQNIYNYFGYILSFIIILGISFGIYKIFKIKKSKKN